ncbi:MAG: hypothetical protein EBT85_08435, partial [Synechococcaceae bacterium WB5_2B_268]|nr:hypothetical protein [Synechococcaceae bacterium WB5_2B_268]
PQAKGKMACSWQLPGEINAPSSSALDGGRLGEAGPRPPKQSPKQLSHGNRSQPLDQVDSMATSNFDESLFPWRTGAPLEPNRWSSVPPQP